MVHPASSVKKNRSTGSFRLSALRTATPLVLWTVVWITEQLDSPVELPIREWIPLYLPPAVTLPDWRLPVDRASALSRSDAAALRILRRTRRSPAASLRNDCNTFRTPPANRRFVLFRNSASMRYSLFACSSDSNVA